MFADNTHTLPARMQINGVVAVLTVWLHCVRASPVSTIIRNNMRTCGDILYWMVLFNYDMCVHSNSCTIESVQK